MILYIIKLSETEVEDLKKIIKKGSHSTQTYRAAYILLNCVKGEFSGNTKITNEEISKHLKVSTGRIC